MSKYTIELRNVIELYKNTEDPVKNWFTKYNYDDYLTPLQIKTIDFNIWNKEKLADKILKKYFMREIRL